MSKMKPHERVNDILLGPLERPALQWFAAHMPAWVTPDVLTIIGTIGAFIIAISYWLSRSNPAWFWVASLGLFINWFGDSLDGTLARYRNIRRPKYGFFVDHTVDAFNEMVVILGLGLTLFIRFDFAAMALIGYLLMSVLVYVTTYVDGVFKISYGRFGPTEMRALLVILNALMFFLGAIWFTLPVIGMISIYDVLVGLVATALIIVFVVSSYRKARELALEDPPPKVP
ncbi:MAG: CDP-alcohol phosphatidyltransferase family protein [Chloroflexota bacterium]|nr:CDP-alcohol phosphatidyltransferase family protein [Chloroflexota bacterium]